MKWKLPNEFYNILKSNCLFDLADNLECLLERIKYNRCKYEILLHLQMRIKSEIRISSGEKYQFFNKNKSVLLYLDNHWVYQDSANKVHKHLSEIIDKIRSTFIPSKGTQITKNDIKNFIPFLDFWLSREEIVSIKHPIRFAFLNCSHKDWTNFYSAQINNKTVNDCIFVLYQTGKLASKEFMIAHEVGHAIHTRLTKKLITVPESFSYFMLDNEFTTSYEIAERFADYFAIAALSSYKQETLNSNVKLPDEYINQIKSYMLLLALDQKKQRTLLELLPMDQDNTVNL